MPCLEITTLKDAFTNQTDFLKEISQAFCKITSHAPETFTIFIKELSQQAIFCNGVYTQVSHFSLFTPKLTQECKNLVISEFSKIFQHNTLENIPAPIIHISEHPYGNIGVEGQSLTEKIPQLKKKHFYYPLNEQSEST